VSFASFNVGSRYKRWHWRSYEARWRGINERHREAAARARTARAKCGAVGRYCERVRRTLDGMYNAQWAGWPVWLRTRLYQRLSFSPRCMHTGAEKAVAQQLPELVAAMRGICTAMGMRCAQPFHLGSGIRQYSSTWAASWCGGKVSG
jgi:hypothetical protein